MIVLDQIINTIETIVLIHKVIVFFYNSVLFRFDTKWELSLAILWKYLLYMAIHFFTQRTEILETKHSYITGLWTIICRGPAWQWQCDCVFSVILPFPGWPLLTLIPTNNCSETCGYMFLSVSVYSSQYIIWVTRQFGTKTFRHQDSSVSRQIGTRTNRHCIFFQTNVISFFKNKIKES